MIVIVDMMILILIIFGDSILGNAYYKQIVCKE